MDLKEYLDKADASIREWEDSWGSFEVHPSLVPDEDRLAWAFSEYLKRLRGNYPFHHPRYAGQMLKPPHPAAVAAYLAAMRINPNNHALDGGPPTSAMEKEVVRDLAAMFGFPGDALGHLTSSGTIANLEALWVSRELAPGKAIAYSEDAHYTHGRMSAVLGVPTVVIPTDGRGHLDLDALENALQAGTISTVVVTAGTTGLGVVDPIEEVLALSERYGVRVHVDAAYGGFFTLLAGDDTTPLSTEVRRRLRAIARCDSVAVDPHKHGLQPYGCGCILFRDPTVGRFYKHDSPYTYFTSDELHLGEISLECSRAGAAAGALWLTLRVLPLESRSGLGAVLSAGLRAAQTWHRLLESSSILAPYTKPELDIVTFYPRMAEPTASRISEISRVLFQKAMDDPEDPVFLSVLQVPAATMGGITRDQERVAILRSVLMKPEHEHQVGHLSERVESITRTLL